VVLPVLPKELVVPTHFSPSMLGSTDPCRLRVLGTASVNRDAVQLMLSSPEAALGTIVHKALERLNRHGTNGVVSFFEECMDATAPASATYARLREAVPAPRIDTARQLVTQKCAEYETRPHVTHIEGKGLKAFGAEVSLSSDELRLSGRPDVLRHSADGTVEIIDYKSGTTLTPDGEVRVEYALQLQAYALMLYERDGDVPVRLIVDNGRQEIVDSSAGALASAREHIDTFTSMFRSDASMPTTDLANPGSECKHCGIRSSCPTYRSVAPSWWRDVPAEVAPVPQDTWGSIVRVTEATESATVDIKDAAGRAVRINALDSRHGVGSTQVDGSLWAFGLRADSHRRGFKGEHPHPRVFHELAPADPAAERAWSAQIFVE
jgi:RecB family exonuclease